MNTHGLKANLKYHQLNLGPSVLIFWAIVFLVMVFSILVNAASENVSIGLFVSQTSDDVYRAVSVVASAFIAVMIYTVVISLVSQPENFSFLVGLGSSRHALYVSQVLALTFIAFVNALIHVSAFALESAVLPLLGLNQLNYLQVYGFRLNLVSLILVQWLILSLVSAVFMVIAAVFYRFRSRTNLIVFIAGMAASIILPRSFGASVWGRLFQWLSNNTSPADLSWKLLLLTFLFWGLGWLVVRRTEAR
jgi:hypothetical protein